MILGIDEVGRGPWAGPLVVGAVVLGGEPIKGLIDSKKISKKKREKLDKEIRKKAKAIGLGWVDAAEIDKIGLSMALSLATKKAVEQIKISYTEIVIDGTVNFLSDTKKGKYVTIMKKADLLVPCVSAASIVAKVARDKYMTKQNINHPGYSFAKNVGYGTLEHIQAIEKLGVTKLHRLSFSPLKKYSNLKVEKLKTIKTITTKNIGDSAETIASKYLENLGHNIINRNWKTKFCEIDIVSKKGDVIYFTEVKYRKKTEQGGGFAVINPKKLRQMKFAAELYSLSNNIVDTNLRLSAISIYGQPMVVEDFLEIF